MLSDPTLKAAQPAAKQAGRYSAAEKPCEIARTAHAAARKVPTTSPACARAAQHVRHPVKARSTRLDGSTPTASTKAAAPTLVLPTGRRPTTPKEFKEKALENLSVEPNDTIRYLIIRPVLTSEQGYLLQQPINEGPPPESKVDNPETPRRHNNHPPAPPAILRPLRTPRIEQSSHPQEFEQLQQRQGPMPEEEESARSNNEQSRTHIHRY